MLNCHGGQVCTCTVWCSYVVVVHHMFLVERHGIWNQRQLYFIWNTSMGCWHSARRGSKIWIHMFVGSLSSQGLKFRLVFGTFCWRGYCIFILKYSARQPWFRFDGGFKTLLCEGYDKLVERNVIKPHIRLQRTVETLRTEEFHMAARVIGYANMQTSQWLLDQ